MKGSDCRIYKFMSEPLRIAGLTVDEIVLGISCFFLFFLVETVFFKILFLLFGTIGIYVMKRFKKLAIGFSMTSYLHWKLGLRFGMSRHCPESWKRRWLP